MYEIRMSEKTNPLGCTAIMSANENGERLECSMYSCAAFSNADAFGYCHNNRRGLCCQIGYYLLLKYAWSLQEKFPNKEVRIDLTSMQGRLQESEHQQNLRGTMKWTKRLEDTELVNAESVQKMKMKYLESYRKAREQRQK